MILDTDRTVAEIAADSLAAVKVFEDLGLDYCCGGKKPLAEVCAQKGFDPQAVARAIDIAMRHRDADKDKDWNKLPLSDLVRHIEERHHAYLRRELPAIGKRLAKAYGKQKHAEKLQGVPEIFDEMQRELIEHISMEEKNLFPAILACDKAAAVSGKLPYLPFGTVNSPMHSMEHKHDEAEGAMRRIREITCDFAVPAEGCPTYRALMEGLKELEEDLHLHIHLENNILFPRVAALFND